MATDSHHQQTPWRFTMLEDPPRIVAAHPDHPPIMLCTKGHVHQYQADGTDPIELIPKPHEIADPECQGHRWNVVETQQGARAVCEFCGIMRRWDVALGRPLYPGTS